MSSSVPSTLDALPKPFVSAMRTLFDVMDDGRTGCVRFADIERRWSRESRDVPSGFVDSLRKVTPSSGLLSFERFCAGLRICLLRHDPPPAKQGSRPASVPLPERGQTMSVRKTATPLAHRTPHQPPPARLAARITHNTATVRPNNSLSLSLAQQRATSMPHLQPKPSYRWNPKKEEPHLLQKKEPMDRNKVSLALEKWRQMKSYHVTGGGEQENQENVRPPPGRSQNLRNSSSYPSLPNEQVSSSDVDSGVGLRPQDRGPAAKKANRRREPRRHTVSNGIDYNMIKRLKLLEQEKDFLLQGLDVVERAHNWYLKQVTNVNDKLDRVSKWDISHSEYSMDAQQERLNFKMTRISEVNQHLNALMETSEKGFPIHMNLAVHQRNIFGQQKAAEQTIQRLKSQNHALTEEIGKKSESITQLETEKSALIRELFHARAYPKKESNDTTLW